MVPASFNIYLASTLHHRRYSRLIIALRPKLCLKLFAESWRRLLLVISSTFSIIIQIKIFKIIIIKKIMMNFYSAISISSWSSTTLCGGLSMGCNEQFTIFLKEFFSDALTFLLFVRSVQVLKPVKNSPQNLKRHSSLFLYNVKQCLFEGNSFPRLHQKIKG